MAASGPEGEGAAAHGTAWATRSGLESPQSPPEADEPQPQQSERRRYPISPYDLTRAMEQLEAARGNAEALDAAYNGLVNEGIIKLQKSDPESDDYSAKNYNYVLEPGIPQAQSVLDRYRELSHELHEAPTEVLPAASEAPTVVLPPAEEAPPSSPEPARPPTPRGDSEDGPRLELHMAGVDREARARALQAAEQKLQQEAAETKGVKGIIRNIWKGALAHEYYKQKYASEFEVEIRAKDNQFTHERGDQKEKDSQQAYYRANEALMSRLVEGHLNADVELHQDERVEQMSDSEAGQKFQADIKELIKDYARGKVTPDDMRERRTQLLNTLQEKNPGFLDGAHMVADNLISVAEQAKAMADNDVMLDQLVDAMQFYADQARGGVRTEVHRNLGDKLVERAQRSRLGRFANETTIASAVSIAYSAATLASKRTVGATMATILPGAGAGLFAGMRENLRFKQERAQHMRERAEGTDFGEPGAGKRRGAYFEARGRREKMEAARYETVSARSLIEALQVPPDSLTAEQAQSLLQSLAQARARSHVSNSNEVDLISFSAVDKVDAERFELDLAVATAKSALRQWYESADPAARASLGNADSFDHLLHVGREAAAVELRGEIKAKDRVFAQMKARAVAKATAKGVMTGLAFGILSQEVTAFLNPNQQGELESLLGHHDSIRGNQTAHQTLLRSIFSGSSGNGHAGEAAVGPIFHERIDGHNTVRLPHGFVLRHHGPNGRGGMTLLEGDKPLARGLHMNQQGFTPHSQEILQKLGIAEQHHLVAVHEARQVVEHTSAREYFAHHPEGMAHVERTLWYDNDTPHVFDKNELRLWWGGHDNNGLVRGDNYQFNVSQMTPDGSYHTPFSANAQALMREGRLRVLLSASQDTQSHPFSLPIDAQGNAQIPRDSVAGHSLFSRSDGHAVFRGRFAEVVQVVGHSHGREQVRILATYEGHGVETIRHSVTRELPTQRLVTTLQMPAEHAPVVTDAPPVIPINSRREMEPLKETPPPPPPSGINIYGPEGSVPGGRHFLGVENEVWQRQWAEQRSPRLTQNPDTELQPNEELSWYFDRLEGENGGQYLAELDRNIEQSEIQQLIDSDTHAFVCIPVAGAYESGNIYNTLAQYAKQDAEAVRQTVIALHINWINDADMSKVQATLAEIERAKRDFPELRLASFTSEYTREWVDQQDNKLYGPVTKELYDTAMRALQQAQASGRVGADHDAVLITNDADAKAIGPHYLGRFIKTFRDNPDRDVFFGRLKWDTGRYDDYPGFAIVSTAVEAMDVVSRIPQFSAIHTPGANSGYRISTLAAVGGSNGDIGAGVDGELSRRIRAGRSVQEPASATGGGYASPVLSRNIGAYVPAAWIDTDGDRMLTAYTEGRPVMGIWDEWDEGGYKPREGLAVEGKEDPEKDFDVIIERAERQISDLINGWEPEIYSRAFNAIYRGEGSSPGWTVSGSNEAPEFHFTAAGKRVIQGFLQDKEYGSYGARVRAIWHEGQPFLKPARTA